MEIEKPEKPIDSFYRLNVKKNYKGEIGWEFTVRGDTIEEISIRTESMKKYIEENIDKKPDKIEEEDYENPDRDTPE